MSKFLSEIDKKRFGFNIAKINEWDTSPAKLIQQLRNDNIKLVISRLPTENVTLINELESLGFQLKDTQLTYRFDLSRIFFDSVEIPDKLEMREIVEADLPLAAKLAKNSFKGYGHYANNKQLDQSKIEEIYEDWVVNSFNNPDFADKFLVIASGEDIAGFLTFKLINQNGKKYAKGGIGAVSEVYRNQGIFKLLNKGGLLWGKTLGLDWIEHNALSTNYSVGRVFTSLGFYNAASYVTLHCWLE
ncbi:TDP-fucosamine acetyltransferase [Legionella clemsonensis]|uniref:TDP-fucosamine acetyltransferase n=2 Tax=Legionella clemsonensis TaxID=1867846 RepID=A0A222P3N0_9GAMM|nr:TDP-fucosamine acetyltransferase [Legionella clemsonensis]